MYYYLKYKYMAKMAHFQTETNWRPNTKHLRMCQHPRCVNKTGKNIIFIRSCDHELTYILFKPEKYVTRKL